MGPFTGRPGRGGLRMRPPWRVGRASFAPQPSGCPCNWSCASSRAPRRSKPPLSTARLVLLFRRTRWELCRQSFPVYAPGCFLHGGVDRQHLTGDRLGAVGGRNGRPWPSPSVLRMLTSRSIPILRSVWRLRLGTGWRSPRRVAGGRGRHDGYDPAGGGVRALSTMAKAINPPTRIRGARSRQPPAVGCRRLENAAPRATSRRA
jgi:hypothetical protein